MSTRVLGIDPGSRVTGYGVVEWQRGRTRYVASGCVRVQASDAAVRLAEIYAAVSTLIDTHAPSIVAVEQVFLARNASSALKLGQARGVALAAAAGRGVPVAEYAARRVKQALTGTGAATKEQVQHMVKALLGLSATPMRDAADALAIAICHINTQGPLSGNGRRGR